MPTTRPRRPAPPRWSRPRTAARCSSRPIPHDLLEDLIITTAGGYHLLRLVQTDFDSRLVLYVWLDRVHGNLAVARRRMQTPRRRARRDLTTAAPTVST